MANPLSTIFAVMLLVIAVVFVPVYQSYQKQDELVYLNAKKEVTELVDTVLTKGYITAKMVEDFETKLEVGDYIFRTEFTHARKVYTPVYTNPRQASSFTGDYVVQYDEFYKDQIMTVLFDNNQPKKKYDRKYYLSVGDTFTVNVENINRTKSSMIFDFLTVSNTGDVAKIVIPYGGRVLNEDF